MKHPTIHYSRAVEDWDWPDELDGLLASAAHHRFLLENERARVLETVIPPGETTAIHTHRWPSVQHVVIGSDIVRRDAELRVIVVELKDPALRPPG
jgi:quercetin dioxygenase-like cupin family protein